MIKSKVVLIYSGGMDSFTLLHHLYIQGFQLLPISFDYGQRHRKELTYASSVCAELSLPHHVVDLSSVTKLISTSSLTGSRPVPEGHYEEPTMKQTVVPNRNMFMLSLAAAYAMTQDPPAAVCFGAHAGDHAIYPDCRRDFVDSMNDTLRVGNYEAPIVYAPFLNSTKGQIAAIGKELCLDYSKAWTCYNGREKACGKCGACQERIEAMAEAGIEDGMEYEDER